METQPTIISVSINDVIYQFPVPEGYAALQICTTPDEVQLTAIKNGKREVIESQRRIS